jgi:hypothetical protein
MKDPSQQPGSRVVTYTVRVGFGDCDPSARRVVSQFFHRTNAASRPLSFNDPFVLLHLGLKPPLSIGRSQL